MISKYLYDPFAYIIIEKMSKTPTKIKGEFPELAPKKIFPSQPTIFKNKKIKLISI